MADSFSAFVLDQLNALGAVSCRAMFGGYGLYCGNRFFGILFKGRLYFKTDETTRAAYLASGMKPFKPNNKQTLSSYYEVPVDVLEDTDQLIGWARGAVAAQSKASPRRRTIRQHSALSRRR